LTVVLTEALERDIFVSFFFFNQKCHKAVSDCSALIEPQVRPEFKFIFSSWICILYGLYPSQTNAVFKESLKFSELLISHYHLSVLSYRGWKSWSRENLHAMSPPSPGKMRKNRNELWNDCTSLHSSNSKETG